MTQAKQSQRLWAEVSATTPWTAKAKAQQPGERARSVTADIHAATVKAALGLEPLGEVIVEKQGDRS